MTRFTVTYHYYKGGGGYGVLHRDVDADSPEDAIEHARNLEARQARIDRVSDTSYWQHATAEPTHKEQA